MTRTEKLVREFAENVVAQTDAIRRGDPRTGNKYAKRYIRAFQALRALGDQGRDALVPLMLEGRDDVRGMAAAFLLRHRLSEAHRVLQDLARGEGFVAFSAAETLKRWNEGAWELDPP
jgi:predicted ArsR family transcriptional regulator